MYGRKASQLVKEVVSSEPGQLSTFNNDLFAQVIEECNQHILQLQALFRKMQEEGTSNQPTKNPDHCGALFHHLTLVRNKRCLMAYVYNRAEIIQKLVWTINIPGEIQEKLSSTEKEYYDKQKNILAKYKHKLDIDMSLDLVPPKDPYIKVRVLEDMGDCFFGAQATKVAKHAILFLRRTDVESHISEGKMEELTS
uniref:DNA replication complex GINS protein PSF1 n=1 Tax=Erigeron canadensis TaxID=72917 RepID=UPI001CB95A99|nr:DNA replication complex GINS protein PSF1 [Erigeron canadensis]XP_043626738.1 DNA replication complex GINS protein PSF1 [Erigeron canadensis]